MIQYTEDEAKEVIVQLGSEATKETPDKPFVTTILPENSISQWLVVPSTNPRIDYSQVTEAIDVEVTELRPNIPTTQLTFFTKEQYDTLLSQSLELNLTIQKLVADVTDLNTKVAEAEVRANTEIAQRLGTQQTNLVLLNQLTSLSDTINSFGEQIANAVQKSFEESIFRNSLQAQNEGFKAQIQALISQADSLNAIITGLYAQLGASQVQQEIEQAASSLASDLQGLNINNVVVTRSMLQIWYDSRASDGQFEFRGSINNKTGETKWLAGDDLVFVNANNLPAKIEILIDYPKTSTTSVDYRKFFTFELDNFFLAPKDRRTIKSILNSNDPSVWSLWGATVKTFWGTYPQSKNYYYGKVRLKVSVENLQPLEKSFDLALVVAHPDSY